MSKKAFVALVTCFNEDETINYEATRAQVRRQVAAGQTLEDMELIHKEMVVRI